jgi:hypothetical protein
MAGPMGVSVCCGGVRGLCVDANPSTCLCSREAAACLQSSSSPSQLSVERVRATLLACLHAAARVERSVCLCVSC